MNTRETLPGTDPVVDARFALANPEVAHSPKHYREIVAGLLDQRDALLAALKAQVNMQQASDVDEAYRLTGIAFAKAKVNGGAL